ncbi:hypothetical protein HanXRQr2_Chr06g0265561 [Helianthus annuus]|uniref:Uncharacterized protein n=1 Tax=Helianthus annuus TaxID=4232 RepID=A0A9K3ITX9_HELAN|nr:hypothetical protein HanXRQr2_Chr06g0265561 [Helianthus annuus]KAJ0560989.1 hypothetical protein HanHA300_Chr06g0217711 [Helianthus annuus]KAJ0574027.1 hypothetical protein HanHA89_Chr06g0233501 [Helianthus annuus]KAJ0738363.1 hypothetical protein HanLR1_Chr06g0217441 [Helianthus annuus]KAJ0741251.1 hypothetical protein HanOQP8_Chr06g0225951 [Helianthus annuus]
MCVTFYITCSLTEPAAKRRGLNLVKINKRTHWSSCRVEMDAWLRPSSQEPPSPSSSSRRHKPTGISHRFIVTSSLSPTAAAPHQCRRLFLSLGSPLFHSLP